MNTLLLPPAFETTLVIGQGPSGPPGPPGPVGGSGASYVAAASVGGHLALAERADGSVSYASCAVADDALRVVGVSLGAAAAGDLVTVQASGSVQHSGWAWAPDAPVFLGLDGALVQTLPAGAAFSLVIGWAVAPDRVLVGLQPPIVLA